MMQVDAPQGLKKKTKKNFLNFFFLVSSYTECDVNDKGDIDEVIYLATDVCLHPERYKKKRKSSIFGGLFESSAPEE